MAHIISRLSASVHKFKTSIYHNYLYFLYIDTGIAIFFGATGARWGRGQCSIFYGRGVGGGGCGRSSAASQQSTESLCANTKRI